MRIAVCGALYELLTGLPESDRPYHFYTDQRFALVLLCALLILPMSIHKEIAVQKYSRSVIHVALTHFEQTCFRAAKTLRAAGRHHVTYPLPTLSPEQHIHILVLHHVLQR